MSISANDFSQENAESDSDAGSDVVEDEYQQIAAFDDHDSDTESSMESDGADLGANSGEHTSLHLENPNFRNFSNGFHHAENGVAALNLNGNGAFDGYGESSDDEEEEEEEERLREASEQAISRAFTEDERRRNAPLTPENASRIVDVMRGVSFRGFPPDWAARVPEEQWMDRLRRLREPTSQK